MTDPASRIAAIQQRLEAYRSGGWAMEHDPAEAGQAWQEFVPVARDLFGHSPSDLAYCLQRIARLEAALTKVIASAVPNAQDQPAMAAAWKEAEAALAEEG